MMTKIPCVEEHVVKYDNDNRKCLRTYSIDNDSCVSLDLDKVVMARAFTGYLEKPNKSTEPATMVELHMSDSLKVVTLLEAWLANRLGLFGFGG